MRHGLARKGLQLNGARGSGLLAAAERFLKGLFPRAARRGLNGQDFRQLLSGGLVCGINRDGLLEFSCGVVLPSFGENSAPLLQVEKRSLGARNPLVENVKRIVRLRLKRLLVIDQRRVIVLAQLSLPALAERRAAGAASHRGKYQEHRHKQPNLSSLHLSPHSPANPLIKTLS